MEEGRTLCEKEKERGMKSKNRLFYEIKNKEFNMDYGS
jgi:hypothetical protein